MAAFPALARPDRGRDGDSHIARLGGDNGFDTAQEERVADKSCVRPSRIESQCAAAAPHALERRGSLGALARISAVFLAKVDSRRTRFRDRYTPSKEAGKLFPVVW